MGILEGSPPGEINKTEVKRWQDNLITFLIPLALIYLGSIVVVVQAPGHFITYTDLYPTQVTIGAMILYVINGAYDFLRKYLGNGTK